MRLAVGLFGCLFALWLLWSGHYTSGITTLGAVSCLLVVCLARRMGIVDREGVPLHLARRAPGRKTLAVAFVEVADGETAPESYAETFGGVLPFDYVWFTPRFDDTDHCAELEKRFRMHRAG